MNPLIKTQLDKVKYIPLPPYDENTTKLVIPKCGNNPIPQKPIELQPDHFYLIKVEDYIVKPFDGFTLHDNWNKGIAPKHPYMKIQVLKLMGNMMNVNSIGFDYENNQDTQDMWTGWLPKKSIHILQELFYE